MAKAVELSSPRRHENGHILNAMSVDVEEFFQVGAFENCIAKADWGGFESRVARATNEILDLFAKHDTKSTFFCLGWVAERQGELIRRIVSEGHELASHGYDHARVFTLSEKAFREDVKKTQAILEDISGVAIKGYRAPSFSIDHRTPWAHAVLADLGYRYSSSVYPVKHDHYGMPDAPRFAYKIADSDLIEVPMTTVDIFGKHLPSSGGGYFRLFPYSVSRALLRRVNRQDRASAVFYMHPWEVDPDQPRQSQAQAKARFRHYVNLSKTKAKLERLLQDFSWDRMDKIYLEE